VYQLVDGVKYETDLQNDFLIGTFRTEEAALMGLMSTLANAQKSLVDVTVKSHPVCQCCIRRHLHVKTTTVSTDSVFCPQTLLTTRANALLDIPVWTNGDDELNEFKRTSFFAPP